jgi:uncharacterized protein (DUF1015 family)
LGAHHQTGVLATCHVDDYFADVIKKHEKTKKPTEDDRTRHVLTVGAQTGPFSCCTATSRRWTGLVEETQRGTPIV